MRPSPSKYIYEYILETKTLKQMTVLSVARSRVLDVCIISAILGVTAIVGALALVLVCCSQVRVSATMWFFFALWAMVVGDLHDEVVLLMDHIDPSVPLMRRQIPARHSLILS